MTAQQLQRIRARHRKAKLRCQVVHLRWALSLSPEQRENWKDWAFTVVDFEGLIVTGVGCDGAPGWNPIWWKRMMDHNRGAPGSAKQAR